MAKRQEFLSMCPFCGMRNCMSHKTYTDRCEDCGSRYNRYSNYKSLQRSNYTNKRQRLLDEIILDYQILKRQGFKVPRDIPD